jgi:DNA-binding transcriptional LysR family regulator
VETARVLHNCMNEHSSYLFLNMQPELDWALMRVFLAAHEHGSLLGAAKALGSHQPTVGRQIQALEAQLGVTLFERTGRGLRATPAADAMAQAAQPMRNGAAAVLRCADAAQSLAGSVRLSASTPVAYSLLPPLLVGMRQALPQVQVELLATNEVSNLLQRDADIALRMVPPDQASTIARRVGEVRIGAYAHPSYLAARGEPRSPQELAQHDFIGPASDSTLRDGLAAQGVHPAPERFVLRTDDLLAQWGAVRAGLGLGFISQHSAGTDPAVRPLFGGQVFVTIPMWLVAHRELRSSARIRAVFDHLAPALEHALAAKPTRNSTSETLSNKEQ